MWQQDDEQCDTGGTQLTQLTQSSAAAVQDRLRDFLSTNRDIFEKILMYEPLELDVLKQRIAGAGIRSVEAEAGGKGMAGVTYGLRGNFQAIGYNVSRDVFSSQNIKKRKGEENNGNRKKQMEKGILKNGKREQKEKRGRKMLIHYIS